LFSVFYLNTTVVGVYNIVLTTGESGNTECGWIFHITWFRSWL